MSAKENPRQRLEQDIAHLKRKLFAAEADLPALERARSTANLNYQIAKSHELVTCANELAAAEQRLKNLNTHVQNIKSALTEAEQQLARFEREASARLNRTVVESIGRDLKRAASDVTALADHLAKAVELYITIIKTVSAAKQRSRFFPEWGLGSRKQIEDLVCAGLYRLSAPLVVPALPSKQAYDRAFPGAEAPSQEFWDRPSAIEPIAKVFAENVDKIMRHLAGETFDVLLKSIPQSNEPTHSAAAHDLLLTEGN
jgi:hypothetical protein